MVAHQVTDDLFSRDLKFTENGIRMPFGSEGSWHLATARGSYSFYIPDMETQQVAFLGTLKERGRNADDRRTAPKETAPAHGSDRSSLPARGCRRA
jgi:hypothetical protein